MFLFKLECRNYRASDNRSKYGNAQPDYENCVLFETIL